MALCDIDRFGRCSVSELKRSHLLKAPGGVLTGFELYQNGSKMVPKWSQNGPQNCPQNGPKMVQNYPGMVPKSLLNKLEGWLALLGGLKQSSLDLQLLSNQPF